MIARSAKVRELLCRTLPDGSESCFVSVAFDEGATTTVRISRAEHDTFAAALRSNAQFAITVHVERPAAAKGAAT